MKKGMVIFLLACLLAGCSNSKQAISGDTLYVAKGYQQQLSKMGLTEVRAFPYFHDPFITVAHDVAEKQYAVIFHADGTIEKKQLPLPIDSIVQRFESYGYPVKEDISNLNLFEIQNQLVWCYNEKGTANYLSDEGKEINPFAK